MDISYTSKVYLEPSFIKCFGFNLQDPLCYFQSYSTWISWNSCSKKHQKQLVNFPWIWASASCMLLQKGCFIIIHTIHFKLLVSTHNNDSTVFFIPHSWQKNMTTHSTQICSFCNILSWTTATVIQSVVITADYRLLPQCVWQPHRAGPTH